MATNSAHQIIALPYFPVAQYCGILMAAFLSILDASIRLWVTFHTALIMKIITVHVQSLLRASTPLGKLATPTGISY